MPIIFEKSARSSMWLKLVHFLMAIFVSIALGAFAWIIDDLFVWIVVGLFMLIGIAIAVSTFRQMVVYSQAHAVWRVEIDDTYLVWQSPVEDLFRSFRLRLEEIDHTQFILVTSGGSKSRSSKREFFIHLNNGRTIHIPCQQGGVWVGDVFQALKERDIEYLQEKSRFEEFNPVKDGFDIIPMKAWPN